MKKKQTLKQILNKLQTAVHLYDGSIPMYEGAPKRKKNCFFGCNFKDEPCIAIKWSEKGRGFGEYTFYEENGKLYCNNECDSKETVKRIMCQLVDDAIFTEVHKEIKCKKSKVKSNLKQKFTTTKLPRSQKD